MSVSQLLKRPGGVIGRPPTAGSGVWSLDDLNRYPQLTIPGLVMWIDVSDTKSVFQNSDGTTATSAEDPVGFLKDLSGLNNNAIQTSSTARPTLKGNNQNGLPGLLFDGINDYMTASIDGFQSFSDVTIIQVIKPTTAATADTQTLVAWGFGAATVSTPRDISLVSATSSFAGETITFLLDRGSAARLGSSSYARSANTASFMVFKAGAGGTEFEVNNVSQTFNLFSGGVTAATASGPSATGYTADNDLHICAYKAASIAVSPETTLHEMIVYNRILTNTELDRLWWALKAKWGI